MSPSVDGTRTECGKKASIRSELMSFGGFQEQPSTTRLAVNRTTVLHPTLLWILLTIRNRASNLGNDSTSAASWFNINGFLNWAPKTSLGGVEAETDRSLSGSNT